MFMRETTSFFLPLSLSFSLSLCIHEITYNVLRLLT